MIPPRPYGLLAELTHRCPLHCPYCSNPIELAARSEELPVEIWERVLREAADLGVLQLGLSGGEPLLYPGLDPLVATARSLGLYTNLITSGAGLTEDRIARLQAAGLDTAQLSFQSDAAPLADEIAGIPIHETKLKVAALLREAGLPFSVNVVLHRANIERMQAMIHLAENLGALRIELANTQFYGWAFKNRANLLPTREQIANAEQIAKSEAVRLAGKLHVIYVASDYYERRPKPCLHGWGSRGITVNPRGDMLPCQAANAIPGLAFENVRDKSLRDIWLGGDAFNRFRGTEWMPDPCRTCDLREVDFGGCRCQAALFTGDASRPDPVCELSPDRHLIDEMLELSKADRQWTPRQLAEAR